MSGLNNRPFGYACEAAAAHFLEKQGYTIVCRNYTVKGGEIDLIAENESTVLFVEVKGRTEGSSLQKYGRPAAAVTPSKRQHLIFAAKDYLRRADIAKKPRMDVIEVYVQPFEGCYALRIKHYPNAFPASSS